MSVLESDYPDWLRVDQWVGAPFLLGQVNNVATNQVFGPFHTAPWEAITLVAFQAGGVATSFQVQVQWWADLAMTTLIDTELLTCQAGQAAGDVLAVIGPYMSFTMVLTATPRNFRFTVIPQRGSNMARLRLSADPLSSGFAAAVGGGGATVASQIVSVGATDAVLSILTSSPTWHAWVEYQDIAGANVGVCAGMSSKVYGLAGSVDLTLPPSPCWFIFQNDDAAAANVSWGIVPRQY